MSEPLPSRTSAKTDADLVRHLYSRRAFWGSSAVLLRRDHPMLWDKVEGNYQNWEVNTSERVPDADAVDGELAKVFYSDDVTVWISRRAESMPHFFRNCDADELHLISQGGLAYETDLGTIEVREHDVLVIPKGVTYRALIPTAQATLRMIVESGPEVFAVPTEMVDHIYGKGRPPLDAAKLRRPVLATAPPSDGPFEVRVKYSGAFAEFLGEYSTLSYEHHPLDVEIIDGDQPVFAFNLADVDKLGTTPIPFVGAAYLDNRSNLAWTLHLTSGSRGAPVHRDPDVDELHYRVSGPKAGSFVFTPQGVDHGAGRGYTKPERNTPRAEYDTGWTVSLYTGRPLKGTALAYQCARPVLA